MKQVILDFKQFKTREEVHEYLSSILEFPAFYGRNLDALYDILSVFPDEVSFYLFSCGRPFEEGFMTVINDAAEENARIKVFQSELP